MLFPGLSRGKIFKKGTALNYIESNYQTAKTETKTNKKALIVKYTYSEVPIRDLKSACGQCKVNSAGVFPPLVIGRVN